MRELKYDRHEAVQGRWTDSGGRIELSCPQCGWRDFLGQRGHQEDDGSIVVLFRCKNPTPIVKKVVLYKPKLELCGLWDRLVLLPRTARRVQESI